MGEPRSGDDFIPDSMGEQPSDGERLMRETLRRLQAIDYVPPPDSGFMRQIREELMHTATMLLQDTRMLTADDRRNGHAGPIALLSLPGPKHISRRRSWPTSLATAALVLLTLIGSYFAFGRGLRPIPQEEAPVLIPAVVGTPEGTPAAGIAEDTRLIQATVRDALPRDVWIGVERMTLAPGAEEPFGSTETHGEGPIAFRVESGEVTFVADGPAVVARASSGTAPSAIEITPGKPVQLTAGDQAFTASGVTSRRRNDGSVPAVTLELSLTTIGTGPDNPEAPYNDLVWTTYYDPPTPPTTVTLRRIMLAPGGSLAVGDLPGLEQLYVESGALHILFDKTPTPTVGNEMRAGTPITGIRTWLKPTDELVNTGNEPLTLLVVTIVSSPKTGAATAAPAA